jgi:fused signal recognition particle receptor
MLGALKKLKEGLAKTRGGLVRTLRGVISGGHALDESLVDQIEETLLAGDVGVRATSRIVGALRDAAKARELPDADAAWALIRREALALLAQDGSGGDASSEGVAPQGRPRVILVVGVNGVGKTTTIGKIAARLAREERRVLLAAGDTFRAAASEQLDLWAQRAGVEIVRQERGADPASVVFDAYARARARSFDVLLIDTAGRLHTKSNLIEELKKVCRVLAKQDPALPDEVLLVLDATTGQNALAQARVFREAVGVTGLVVTKLDGTAKGGVLLALTEELGIPVRYIGVGEGDEDLQDFDANAFVEALLDEGD